MKRRSRTRRVLKWIGLGVTGALAFACAVSCERRLIYHDGVGHSYTLLFGHLRFARYEMPGRDELQVVPNAPPSVGKYLELSYGEPGWHSEGCGWGGPYSLRTWRFWFPPLHTRRYAWRAPDGTGGSGHAVPGFGSFDFPDAKNGAWCVAHRWTVPLHTALLAGLALSAMAWCPRLVRGLRSNRWRSQGRCGTCGYNLTGNVTGRCPECGTPVEREGKPA